MDVVMSYVVLFLQLFGGLGVFLVGMEMMSNSMSRLAHGKLKNMLNKTASNRFAGVGIGAGVTMIIQSSSATTVMVVGLVNAGIMTLFQATSVIMGANIGTTITAQIAALSAFPFASFLFLLAVVGVFMTMFSKNEKLKTIGNILAGIGLIFVGLEFMSNAMSPKDNAIIMEPIKNVLSAVQNPFLLLLIGAVITGIVQSSSAVTSIVIALAINGLVIGGSGDGVYFVIIGSNIGTCVTALLSSIGASVNARRASTIHLMFNCFGAIVFTAFLLLWSISGTTFSGVVLETLFPGLPATQIAMFHTLFNTVCTCLFLPFIKGFVWLAEHIVPEKKNEKELVDEKAHALFEERLMRQPSVALDYLYNETGNVFARAMNTMDIAFDAFLKKDVSVKERVNAENEALSLDSKEMIDYLVKLSASSLVYEDEKTVSALHYVINDIVRIAELADNVTKYTTHYVEDNLVFSEEFLTMISAMYDKLKTLYALSHECFLKKDASMLPAVDTIEEEIDVARRELVERHIKRLNEGKCQPQNSSTFTNLVCNLERAADHINYIAHAVEQKV